MLNQANARSLTQSASQIRAESGARRNSQNSLLRHPLTRRRTAFEASSYQICPLRFWEGPERIRSAPATTISQYAERRIRGVPPRSRPFPAAVRRLPTGVDAAFVQRARAGDHEAPTWPVVDPPRPEAKGQQPLRSSLTDFALSRRIARQSNRFGDTNDVFLPQDARCDANAVGRPRRELCAGSDGDAARSQRH